MASIHLLVLIHGMWGNPDHLAELVRIVRETHLDPSSDGIKLHVLVSEAIRDESTYDGVDWGGERVAKEVLDKVKELEADGDRVVRFSATGYSLGGLIARYCVGVLHQQDFFEQIHPVNFNTIATPHCGLPRYNSFLSSITNTLGPKLLSRTGEQFYCVDKWSPKGRPLLVVMADPGHVFYQALSKFQHLRVYANSINDLTVPYVTAAIQMSDPFIEQDTNGIKMEFHEKYPCLIKNYSLPDNPPPQPPQPPFLSINWIKSIKAPRPILPPALQFAFPFNVVIYTLLPLLLPMFISMVLVRLSLASRSSRARIKMLEAEAHTGNRQTLVNLLDEIDREMEDVVVDFIDDPDTTSKYPLVTSKAQPILTPSHKQIAHWLNALPIKKEMAYFSTVRNSHAMIISRDVKRFELHRLGEPVVRHWANSLIL